jgi:hypothetical protein
MGQLTTEILGNSEIEDSIDEALDKIGLEKEVNELKEIEGEDGYEEPINEDDPDYAVDEDDVSDEDDELE